MDNSKCWWVCKVVGVNLKRYSIVENSLLVFYVEFIYRKNKNISFKIVFLGVGM